jgi:hypothetical protein
MRAYLDLWRLEERTDGKRESKPLRRWDGHAPFCRDFRKLETHRACSVRRIQGE